MGEVMFRLLIRNNVRGKKVKEKNQAAKDFISCENMKVRQTFQTHENGKNSSTGPAGTVKGPWAEGKLLLLEE